MTPAAGAEVAARAVPHVPVVVHRALVQAAPLGGGAFITALTRALHLGVTLREETGRSGLGFIRQPLFSFLFFSFLPQMSIILQKVVEEEGSCAAVHPSNAGMQTFSKVTQNETQQAHNGSVLNNMAACGIM